MVLPITIITGASSGIGLSLTRLLSSENHIVLALARSISQVKEFQNNKNIICAPMDLTNESEILKVPEHLGIKYKAKYLINCSATLNIKDNLIDYTYNELEYMFKLNTIAPVFLISTLIKNKCFLDRTRILNIGTKAAHVPIPHMYGYCLTKSALYMSYLCFREELSRKGIFIGSLQPGVVHTKMIEEMIEKGGRIGGKEILKPEIVANFIKYVISNGISDERFSEEEWDIYNRNHHSKWNLNNDYIPLQAPMIRF